MLRHISDQIKKDKSIIPNIKKLIWRTPYFMQITLDKHGKYLSRSITDNPRYYVIDFGKLRFCVDKQNKFIELTEEIELDILL
jgi:hypothetical protein